MTCINQLCTQGDPELPHGHFVLTDAHTPIIPGEFRCEECKRDLQNGDRYVNYEEDEPIWCESCWFN